MPTSKEYQAMLKDGCPYCGEALVIKRGRYGEFIACSDWCGYKKSILGRSEYPPPKAVKQICPYKKCDGSGLLPFVKNNKLIPYAWVDCECKPERLEYYQDLMLADLDFSMSDTFRGFSFEYCSQPDPGYMPLEPEAPPPQVIEHRHSDMSKKDFARLQNLEGQVKYLQGKLMERAKPEHTAKPAAYKGIK